MKRVRGPESESRLVGLQVAEFGGLSGKGRATYTGKVVCIQSCGPLLMSDSVLILLGYVIYLTQRFFFLYFIENKYCLDYIQHVKNQIKARKYLLWIQVSLQNTDSAFY